MSSVAETTDAHTTPVEGAPVETTGSFTFADWEEQPVGAADGAPRLARAKVVNHFSGGIEAPGTSCAYTIAYTGENVGTYTGMELLAGTVDGRAGSFVLEERGSFDAEGTRCAFTVVPGSGTGALAGLSGSGGFVHRHGTEAVPYTFTYALAHPSA
ncbi:DUF3224 domain-containing protein [Streptomyces sp. NBC_00249]|uniref:DUF3224 domain-containing protein n=1 Tax=Streptomyces sp. NBC_00249 TaxID=2975690 RepID=UPI00224F8F2F|nr:DUF3224 domain-containing protein [Streptomyces sp. NBC_00249]MCX5195289.1 DUF3224 domain-containing protein [Streptomyces sp. NBC_00249]